jgi:hypothetical protein
LVVHSRGSPAALARLVVRPSRLGVGDGLLLPGLGAAAEQDDEFGAVLPDVDPVARPEVYPHLGYALADALQRGGVARLQPGQRRGHLRRRLSGEALEPAPEGAAALLVLVLAQHRHGLLVPYVIPISKGRYSSLR